MNTSTQTPNAHADLNLDEVRRNIENDVAAVRAARESFEANASSFIDKAENLGDESSLDALVSDEGESAALEEDKSTFDADLDDAFLSLATKRQS